MSTNDVTWNQTKKKIQADWPALKEEELEQTHGDRMALVNLIQKKYIITYEQAMASIIELLPNLKPTPQLPNTEIPSIPNETPNELRKIEDDNHPIYPNKLYEEELPPDIKLDDEEL